MPLFNPAMIVLGREARGHNQLRLAALIDSSQSKLSKYENGILQVSDEDRAALVRELGFTQEFFETTGDVFGFGSICFYHRKRSSAPLSTLKQIQARLNVLRLQVPRLCKDVSIGVQYELPSLDADEVGGPAEAARVLRKAWKLPMGRIDSIVGILERAGVFVQRVDFGTDKLDAVSQVIPGFTPVFMVNSRAPGDRLRFTLCHELAHVVMHKNHSEDMERQADEFASEFLMPADEIATQLRKLEMDKLPALKSHWKVSMAAIIKRAADLERISPRQYRTLYTQLSSHGWRKREPIEIAVEQPTVLAKILSIHENTHGMTRTELARLLMWTNPDEVSTLLPPAPHRLRVV